MQSAVLQAEMDKTWSIKDVCKLFHKTNMTIQTWRQTRGLPAIVIKGDRPAVRFVPEDVLAWAEKNGVPTKKIRKKTIKA